MEWFPKVDDNMFLNCLSLMGKGMALRSPLVKNSSDITYSSLHWILITKKYGSCKIGHPNKVNNGLVVLRVFSLVSPWGFTQIHWSTVNVPFNQCRESYPLLQGEYDDFYRFIQKPMKPATSCRLPSRLTMKKILPHSAPPSPISRRPPWPFLACHQLFFSSPQTHGEKPRAQVQPGATRPPLQSDHLVFA